MNKAEFDKYAPAYDAGMDNAAKRWAGDSAQDYLHPKLNLLLEKYVNPDNKIDYLDFGCGTGEFLSLVNARCPHWHIEGCDISSEMLQTCKRRWPLLNQRARLWVADSQSFPLSKYNLITAVCVFHHIPPHELDDCVARLIKALRPGGSLILIEHNSWNPVTRWVVAHTEIDKNATLLSPRFARKLFKSHGLTTRRFDSFMYFPPRWKTIVKLERLFTRIPLGGQYMMEAQRIA